MRVAALILALVALAGCSTRVGVDRAVIDTRDGTITLDSAGHGHGKRGFCPPGQAKKGRC